MADHVGALVIECGVAVASLLGDEACVRFARRLPSEFHDLESIYVLESALDSRDDVFLEGCVRL